MKLFFIRALLLFTLFPIVLSVLMHVVESLGLVWLFVSTFYFYPLQWLGPIFIRSIENGLLVATPVGIAVSALSYTMAACAVRYVYIKYKTHNKSLNNGRA